MKSKNCQPAKGSSLSTCCGSGCYKHLSNLNWVCNTVMFPSRCYLPTSGTMPCTQGVSAGRNTYTISHSHTHTQTGIQQLEKYTRRWRRRKKKGKGKWRGACSEDEEVVSPSSALTRWALSCPEDWLHKQHCWLVKQKEKALSHHLI